MEFMYQYIGSGKHSAPLCVYASPSENKFEKCGELRRGAYFASSKTLYLSSQIWLQIRQGTFSNHKKNGYIPVSLVYDSDPCSTNPPITRFRNLLKLPSFPVFLHALQPLRVSRIPMFVTAQSPEPHTRVPHRVLQPHSVIEATQCQWNDNYTQIALQIKSFHGTTGWTVIPFGTLFEQAFVIVGSPVHYSCRSNVVGSRYVQNIASRSGRKWKGGLPYRAVPMLQAPRVGVLGPFQIVKLLERKTVKDQVWLEVEIQCESNQSQNASDERSNQGELSTIPLEDRCESSGDTKAVWIVERNVNTGEQVVIPWGVAGGFTELLSQDTSRDPDGIERYYRNVYTEKSLFIRSGAHTDAEIAGQLEPGTVFSSNSRVLNRDGQIWVRVAMTVTGDPQDDKYGYVVQSDPGDNRCLLQEIRRPGKIEPKESVQICCKSENTPDANNLSSLGVTIYCEPSTASKKLCRVKNGAIFSVIGSIYNQKCRSIWYQLLVEDVIEETILADAAGEGSTIELARELKQVDQLVVYLPACEPEYETPWFTNIHLVGRSIQIEMVDQNTQMSLMDGPKWKESALKARIVFSARASKLFGLYPASLPSTNAESEVASLSSPRDASLNNSGSNSGGHKMIRMERPQSICALFQSYVINWKHWLEPMTNCFHQRDDAKYRTIHAATDDSEDEEREAQGMYACSA
uniref:Uncharacterized protein AlNc14C70G4836 n=1 Tax=Albugo laibachii Nc14 TaxID=890382 RepID=F0WDW7_9STRA|nr:conserved hypothetical protein [Albugo laibachii Nc14]|eukprot:CCA19395.1 conserved hypothetical protein [Albugo laibachii Nc14]